MVLIFSVSFAVILLLLLLRSLYILSVLPITAVFISRHLGPVIPTSATKYIEEGESTAGS
jgi:hypothetical protein